MYSEFRMPMQLFMYTTSFCPIVSLRGHLFRNNLNFFAFLNSLIHISRCLAKRYKLGGPKSSTTLPWAARSYAGNKKKNSQNRGCWAWLG